MPPKVNEDTMGEEYQTTESGIWFSETHLTAGESEYSSSAKNVCKSGLLEDYSVISRISNSKVYEDKLNDVANTGKVERSDVEVISHNTSSLQSGTSTSSAEGMCCKGEEISRNENDISFGLSAYSLGIISSLLFIIVIMQVVVLHQLRNENIGLGHDINALQKQVHDQHIVIEGKGRNINELKFSTDYLRKKISLQQSLLLLHANYYHILKNSLNTTQQQVSEMEKTMEWNNHQFDSMKRDYQNMILQKEIENSKIKILAATEKKKITKVLRYSALVFTMTQNNDFDAMYYDENTEISVVIAEVFEFFRASTVAVVDDQKDEENLLVWASWVINCLCQNFEYHNLIIDNGGLKILSSIIETHSGTIGHTDEWNTVLLLSQARASMELLFTPQTSAGVSTSSSSSMSNNVHAAAATSTRNGKTASNTNSIAFYDKYGYTPLSLFLPTMKFTVLWNYLNRLAICAIERYTSIFDGWL